MISWLEPKDTLSNPHMINWDSGECAGMWSYSPTSVCSIFTQMGARLCSRAKEGKQAHNSYRTQGSRVNVARTACVNILAAHVPLINL